MKPGVDGAEEVVEAELQNTEPEQVQQEHRGQEARLSDGRDSAAVEAAGGSWLLFGT